MLYYLSEYLTNLAEQNEHLKFLSPFRVFTFGTARAGGACVTAFLLSLWIGPWVIRKLVSLKVGQPIRTAEEVHALYDLHEGKGGTPTMGGVMILGTILASTLLWARLDNPFILVLLFVLLTHGYLGFRDDYAKVTQKTSAGVSAKFKLAVQFLSAAAAGAYLYFSPDTRDYIRDFIVPGFSEPFHIDPTWLVVIFVIMTVAVIMGSSNAGEPNRWARRPGDWLHDRGGDDVRDFRLRGRSRGVQQLSEAAVPQASRRGLDFLHGDGRRRLGIFVVQLSSRARFHGRHGLPGIGRLVRNDRGLLPARADAGRRRRRLRH